jgi:hypothetical protein
MGKKIFLILLSGFLVAFYAGIAVAQHQHGHESPSAAPKKGTSHGVHKADQPAQAATVEGFKITLEVMDMSAHMSMPGMKGSSQHGSSDHSKSHAVMVTVQDIASKEIISDAKVRYTLVRPSGGKEMGNLVWSGDHYGGGFSPKEKGAYQVQLMIESGGMEREAKFIYSAK